jgi:radical SAM protein with 4Fe4S-binding SPASM domain
MLPIDKSFAYNYIRQYFRSLVRPKKNIPKKMNKYHSPKFWRIKIEEIVQQRASVYGLPQSYHFLLTNYCNARCKFCNQDFYPETKKEISLESFKAMLSHIPIYTESSFYFSGGGEPMLCGDFFPIIQHATNTAPKSKVYIRTNGTLIKKHMDELIASNIFQLEISVHGASAQRNNDILQIDGSNDIFRDLSELNDRLNKYNIKMRKIFCPVVSPNNLDEIPGLVKKAAALDVDEIRVSFARYFPHHNDKTLGWKDPYSKKSFLRNKKEYNKIIFESKRLAKKLKINLIHEPLFFKKFRKRECFQPWQLIVIDWDGDVYPCCGGEVWFRDKVKSGNYQFGNLLKKHLSQCWNNTSYTMIRRTCSRFFNERHISECRDCHNSICFQGADDYFERLG